MSAALLRMGCAPRCATSCAGTRRTRPPTATCRARSIATAPTGCPSTTATASSCSRSPSTSASPATASFAAELWPAVLRRDALSGAAARAAPRPGVPRARAARVLRPPAGVGEPRGLPGPSRARLLGRLLGAARPRRCGRPGAALGDAGGGEAPARAARCDRRVPLRLDRGDDRGARASPTCRARSSGPTSIRPRPRRRSRRRTPRERLPAAALALHLRRVPRGLPAAAPRRDRLEQLHRLRDPHHRRAGAPRAGARRRTSCSTSSSPIAVRAPGTSGPRSPGATRAARAISATCRTPGSAPSTCSPCSGMLAYESPGERLAGARRRRLRRLARRRGRRGRRACPPGGDRSATAAARRRRTRCASSSRPACARRPAASSCARRSRARSRVSSGDGVVSFDAHSATLRSSAASVRLSF